ncbi:helix-turn-helix domain-containing protein [Legionella genomosp. 1]|uniref:helix-turn-helix domain-containing protein n=1 Tax=Legionella genomosp. 1 TaxID=1093625 RepID=UPI003967A29D
MEERCRISILQREGYSLQKIATALDRSASTISRELKRNITKTKGYDANYAQAQTRARRWTGGQA